MENTEEKTTTTEKLEEILSKFEGVVERLEDAVEKFDSVETASGKLSDGTYTGTAPVSHTRQ